MDPTDANVADEEHALHEATIECEDAEQLSADIDIETSLKNEDADQ